MSDRAPVESKPASEQRFETEDARATEREAGQKATASDDHAEHKGLVPNQKMRIDLDALDGAVGSATDHFVDSVIKFAVALSSEAARLELEERADGQRSPEITGSMVIKANGKVRKPPIDEPPPPPLSAYVSQVMVVPTSLVAGVFGSYLNPLWSWNLVGAAGFGAVAVGCQIHAVFALRGRRRNK